jgi:hypothetical protein
VTHHAYAIITACLLKTKAYRGCDAFPGRRFCVPVKHSAEWL